MTNKAPLENVEAVGVMVNALARAFADCEVSEAEGVFNRLESLLVADRDSGKVDRQVWRQSQDIVDRLRELVKFYYDTGIRT